MFICLLTAAAVLLSASAALSIAQAASDGIARLISVTQMKANDANDAQQQPTPKPEKPVPKQNKPQQQ